MFLACLLTHALPINTLPIEARLTPWLLGEVLRVKGDLHDFATPFMVFFVTDSFAGVCQWQTPVVKACYYFATHPRLTLAVFCLSAVVCVLSRSKPIIHTAIRLASLIFSCKYRTIGPTIALIDSATIGEDDVTLAFKVSTIPPVVVPYASTARKRKR